MKLFNVDSDFFVSPASFIQNYKNQMQYTAEYTNQKCLKTRPKL